ncbi:MAG: Gfo/Idh/MocA family protein [Pirellula sp.]
MQSVRVGVIGCGHWGPNQIRTFYFHPSSTLVRICDRDPGRLVGVSKNYPDVQTTTESREITRATDIDAVIITTPASTHYALVKDALEHGKDVLCEKPLTIASAEAYELAEIAERNGRILMVGHIFLFNAGIFRLKSLISEGSLGDLRYMHAVRTNLGPVRADANAIYDLASHDISVFNYLTGATPKVISAAGRCYLQPAVEDFGFIALEYPSGVFGHIHVSWLDPKKIRKLTVVGTQKMVTWDDLSSQGPIEIHSKKGEQRLDESTGVVSVSIVDGDVQLPLVKSTEPLKQQADHFLSSVVTRRNPVIDGRSAANIVETLEQIDAILRRER